MAKTLAFSVLAICSIVSAETYDASLFTALKWRSIGPNRGGRSITSAGSTSRPLEYYFGAVGGGLWKTTDGGTTWKNIGLTDTQAIARVRVHPTNPDIVYVAAFGHPYGPNTERGVFRSKDGGKTWTKVLYRSDRAGAVDLCFDLHNPNVLYAAIWDAYRTPWSLSSGGSESGLFKTTDGGDTWKEITRNAGLPAGIIGKIGVSASGADF